MISQCWPALICSVRLDPTMHKLAELVVHLTCTDIVPRTASQGTQSIGAPPGNSLLPHGILPAVRGALTVTSSPKLCFPTWDSRRLSVSTPREDAVLDSTGGISHMSLMMDGPPDVGPEPHNCIVTTVTTCSGPKVHPFIARDRMVRFGHGDMMSPGFVLQSRWRPRCQGSSRRGGAPLIAP